MSARAMAARPRSIWRTESPCRARILRWWPRSCRQATSRIGIVPTFGTYAYPPYLLARLIATLDQVSRGRIGWNAVTGSSDFAAMNFGMPGMPEHDLRYDMADEYMEVCRQLWASWEPGAIIADPNSGVLVDHTKVHAVNFEGR